MSRARRAELPEAFQSAAGSGRYAAAFEVDATNARSRTAEQWARQVFEDARAGCGYC